MSEKMQHFMYNEKIKYIIVCGFLESHAVYLPLKQRGYMKRYIPLLFVDE